MLGALRALKLHTPSPNDLVREAHAEGTKDSEHVFLTRVHGRALEEEKHA